MSRRGARLTVAVLFALSSAAAAWLYQRAERALHSRQQQAAAFDREARSVALGIAELRAAQQAYVAAGQGTEYWTGRVGVMTASLKDRVGALRERAQSPEAASRLDNAAASLDDFARMDRRARDYATAGQRLLSSDLIFADGFEMTQAIALDLDGARATEFAHREASARELENEKRLLAGGVAGIGLLLMLILALAGGRSADESRGREPIPEHAVAGPGEPAMPVPDGQVAAPALPAVDLRLAADLCVDLARVTDTQQVPGLLDRAALVLDASGIVLWIADPDGRELVPTVAHGYPAAAIARVGAIPRDADNATAAAFREGRVHTVRGDVLTSGAIAAPLVTPGGCAGVMAAEVRHGREQSEEMRALAAIVAAQLAALIGVAPPAAAQPRAQAN